MLTFLPEFREIDGERDLKLWNPRGVLLLNGTSCTPQKQHGKVFFDLIQCHTPLALFVCYALYAFSVLSVRVGVSARACPCARAYASRHVCIRAFVSTYTWLGSSLIWPSDFSCVLKTI